MKTFVITVSKTFPATHKRKGEPTGFEEKILLGLDCPDCVQRHLPVKCNEVLYPNCLRHRFTQKIHTIRSNYPFWKKRIDQVRAGEAILSIRYWSWKPYNSDQIEICKLGKDDWVGIQELKFYYKCMYYPRIDDNLLTDAISKLSKNDGLSPDDFKEWFKGCDLSEPMAIIHFTKFRY